MPDINNRISDASFASDEGIKIPCAKNAGVRRQSAVVVLDQVWRELSHDLLFSNLAAATLLITQLY
jgi:hypothetical protein